MISEMEIRRLTDTGVEEFRAYLAALRAGDKASPPYRLLNDTGASKAVENAPFIYNRRFQRRLDAAVYLDDVLSNIEIDAIESDVGLWGWLSLFYFEQVCPLEKIGIRRPGRDYRHILEPGYPYGHRHLLCGPYLVYSVYGLAEALSGLLLWTPLHVESQFHHELATRQNLITNRGVMEAAYMLFLNKATRQPKRGSLARKQSPGTLYRFIDLIQQLDLTYDLYSMSGPEVLKLLPPEFDKWKE
jgi:hypothetical protein